MPIEGIYWHGSSNQDIHVLGGQTSRDLTNDLFFVPTANDADDLSAHDYLAANNDVNLIFQPLFNGTLSGNVFSGLHIDVDTRTGQVSPGLDAFKNNFIIEVTATNPADDSAIDTEIIRVHIHLSVKAFALTPPTLTLRPAASTRTAPELTHYRFTVRAKFDDDTMGDLTEHHGVTWSSDPPDHVDPDTGEFIILAGDVAGNTIKVTATLPAELGGGTQTATIQIAQAWRDDPDMPLAPLVVGGGWPGTTLPDKAPNILFISDGYIDVDEPAFVRTVTTMVHHLKTDRLLRPYDLLCPSMNFWHAFVPASVRGTSFRCEVYWDGSDTGWPVPPPEPPPKTGEWKLPHLIYAVGLPVPEDADKTDGELIVDWDNQVDKLPPVPDGGIDRWVGAIHDSIPMAIIGSWKRIASRAFVEELDNYPGMAFGAPPAANTRSGTPILYLHPFRCRRDGLDNFLAALQSVIGVQFGPGANIGALWVTRTRQNVTEYQLKDVIALPSPIREDFTQYELSDFVTVPSNRAGLVFFCTAAGTSDLDEPVDYEDANAGDVVTDGSATFRAMQPLIFVCTTAGISDLNLPADYANAQTGATITDGSATFRAAQPAVFDNPSFVIVLSSFPGGRSANHRRLLEPARRQENVPYIATCTEAGAFKIPLASSAGPMGFALNLTAAPADATLDASRVTGHELGHSLGLGDEYVKRERTYPNDQASLADDLNLQTQDDTETGGEIDGDKIRWSWHRVHKAAVVTAPISEVTTGGFKVPVVPGQAKLFRKDDTVLLRLRFPGQFLAKATDVEVSEALQIAVAPSASASADYLVVQAAPGVTVSLDDLKRFTPGSILFAPVPAPASVRDPDNYPFAEMVAFNVKKLISDKQRPLYRRPTGTALTYEAKHNLETQTPDLDGLSPSLPLSFCFKDKSKIVGLYEGGHEYARGIFHPAGLCVMRNEHVESTELCPVCRYVMVDFVDPFRHFEIDLDYDDIYPLK